MVSPQYKILKELDIITNKCASDKWTLKMFRETEQPIHTNGFVKFLQLYLKSLPYTKEVERVWCRAWCIDSEEKHQAIELVDIESMEMNDHEDFMGFVHLEKLFSIGENLHAVAVYLKTDGPFELNKIIVLNTEHWIKYETFDPEKIRDPNDIIKYDYEGGSLFALFDILQYNAVTGREAGIDEPIIEFYFKPMAFFIKKGIEEGYIVTNEYGLVYNPEHPFITEGWNEFIPITGTERMRDKKGRFTSFRKRNK